MNLNEHWTSFRAEVLTGKELTEKDAQYIFYSGALIGMKLIGEGKIKELAQELVQFIKDVQVEALLVELLKEKEIEKESEGKSN